MDTAKKMVVLGPNQCKAHDHISKPKNIRTPATKWPDLEPCKRYYNLKSNLGHSPISICDAMWVVHWWFDMLPGSRHPLPHHKQVQRIWCPRANSPPVLFLKHLKGESLD